MTDVVFPLSDFRQIGEEYIRRKENDELDGEQVVTVDKDTDSFGLNTDTTETTDESETIRLDAGETLSEDDDELTKAEAHEKLKSGESVAMWRVTDE